MKLVTLIALLGTAFSASAQDVRWELVDAGVLTHSKHGKGIEMRIAPRPMPEGLFESENLDDLMLTLCNHYAPSVIPFVREQTGFETPEFISVRIASKGMIFGRYALQAFATSGNSCGDAL